jgi:succinyl-CoA synthetase alpha subunit
MSIYIDESTQVIVQGITGRDGAFHTQGMIEYGTKVVAGVTPGKGGESLHGVPVYDSVAEARAATGANTSVIYVPAPFAADAVHEAVDAGIKLIVCITEGVPVNDMVEIYAAVERSSSRLIGPNCPGLISPGKSKVGILPGNIHLRGNVGVVSRSGTLTYQVVDHLTRAEIGQTTCIGIGGDPIIGTNFVDTLEQFEADGETEAVVMIGEIGGTDEQEAARFIKASMKTPVVGFIAGRTAPPGKRMGHAGAIISGGGGTAQEKTEALEAAGVPVAKIPSEIPVLVAEALRSR